MGFKKFFDFLHLVKMKRAGHFYYFYDDSPDTTKKTHSGFQQEFGTFLSQVLLKMSYTVFAVTTCAVRAPAGQSGAGDPL